MFKSSEIQNFYQNQKVFVTGGTGFVGQVLVEKLLRSTEVTSIYFLIRDKKGISKNERLDKIFESELFSKLKEVCPNFKNKIIPINGDCSENNLGLSPEDREELVKNVNIVFHAAATIRFDENIKTAYQINFYATKTIGEMCKEMKNLKVFMYVSTAYSNCYLKTIGETVYQHPVDYNELGVRLEKLSNSEASEITDEILRKFSNTYVFTKALSEFFIEKELSHLPVGIFRPSLIISTYKEPIPGWTCSWSGAIQISATLGAGLLRVLQLDKNILLNIVPVDKCVAALVASAWDVSKIHKKTDSSTVSVYNYICPPENGLTYNDYTVLLFQHFPDYPLTNAVWIPQTQYVKNRFYYLYLRTLLHWVPAFLMDVATVACFRKPIMLATYKKVHNVSNLLEAFTLKDWVWWNNNVKELWNKMSDEDKKLFPLTITTVSWPLFVRNVWLGIRLYLFKQKLNSVEKAKKRQRWFQIIEQLMKMSFYFGVFILTGYLWTNIKSIFL